MYSKLIRRLSSILAIVMLITAMPMVNINVNAASDGDLGTAGIVVLGRLGTVNIGNKSEGGTWMKTKVGNSDVFCLDLGKACHTGYVYTASNSRISSDSSNKSTALKAKIGYWYSQTKKRSTKAWMYAQCLIWGIEEGVTDESGLKDIIKQVKNNTGYYDGESIYSDIFDINSTVSCDITTWKYKSSGSNQVQVLMEIQSNSVQFDYKKLNMSDYYRQRITLQKDDEDGKGLPQVTFRFTAKNIKELYTYKFNGWGTPETGDADTDATKFTEDIQTDSNGMITFRFTYKLQTKNYYYVDDEDLKIMSSDDKKKMKADLDDEGYSYASDLSKDGAKKMAQADFDDQMDEIDNSYTIEEISSGNANILSNFTVKSGSNKVTSSSANKITIKLTKADSWTRNSNDEWPETANETYGDYKLAYKPVLEDRYKKASMSVTKKDSETGTTPQGDAKLQGAVYGLYTDAACTKLIEKYTTNSSGHFETKYVRCGFNYYIKEITPPTGYLQNNQVYTVIADGSKFTAEYNSIKLDANEDVKKGSIAITKIITNGDTGEVPPEVNATFQIYLTSAGSYDKAKDTERQILITNEDGYAKTKNLPYGTYTVHQTSGDNKTEFVKDFKVQVTEHGKTYKYHLNNRPYEVYLKITKVDKRTGKTVLKAGTTYEIYSIDENNNYTLIKQKYNDGHKFITVNKFVTDETGKVITYEKLPLGDYAIREVEAVDGLTNDKKDVNISITNDSYEIEQDDEGNQIDVAECTYVNDEAKGVFTISKNGEVLDKFESQSTNENEEKNAFVFKSEYLKNIKFEVYAKEDIITQDNQGTNWFRKDSLVATITTGVGAEFTDNCNGLCEYTIDEKTGNVKVYLPLGEYELKEVSTNYGYVLPETNSWDLSFKWVDQYTNIVLNSTDSTNDEGVIEIKNDRAKANIVLQKIDSVTKQPIANAEFGFYTRNDIYNNDGELICSANELITKVITDEKGYGTVDCDIPLKSELYDGTNKYNSGDYYFKEISISDSFYLDEEEIPVHVEYANQETPVIKSVSVKENIQTSVEVDKYSIARSEEIKGCHLVIKDIKGNDIISWTTGDNESIKINEHAKEYGYNNLTAKLNDKGSIVVNGLLHSNTYTLVETKPADGYVTASNINFKLEQNSEDKNITDVLVETNKQFVKTQYNKVIMYDDTIKVLISKTDIAGSKEIEGCKLVIKDKESGKVIETWTSTDKPHMIENKFAARKKYVLSETRPAKGYVTASNVEFNVLDNGKVQKVSMKDDTTKIEFSKIASDTNKLLNDAEYKVLDKDGKKIYSFKTSDKKPIIIKKKLEVGKTYTFVEVKAPEGYKKAENVKITVKDTGKVQKIKVIDKKIPVVPNTPQTGKTLASIVIAIILALCGFCYVWLRIGKKEEKENEDKED